MGDGIVAGGILGDGCDDGAFGKIQIPDAFAEITPGSGLHAQGVLAQIDGIHIVFQDHRPCSISCSSLTARYCSWILRFSLYAKPRSLSLVHVVSTLFLMSCWVMVLAPSEKFSGGEADVGRAQDAPQVDAVMLVKTLVLDGDKSVGQIRRECPPC